jgi:DNA modification methylase
VKYLETIDAPIGEPQDYPGNARVHDDDWLDRTTAPGQHQSILVRRLDGGTLQILGGHGTRSALRRSGRTTVRCEVMECTDEEALQANLSLNPPPGIGGFDDVALRELLVKADDYGVLESAGWDKDLIEALGSEPVLPALDEPDTEEDDGDEGQPPDEVLVPLPPEEYDRERPSVFYADQDVTIWYADALALPVESETVDLVVTSPPYFGLRSYQDHGEHYGGQIGSEATPTEFVDALIVATREMVRVLKPSGSIWINLGDKYSGGNTTRRGTHGGDASQPDVLPNLRRVAGFPQKSLIGVPWRYALRCIDELGLILRAEVIWSKPNGLPESVTDRVRRSHEQWFHFTREPHYFSAIDEIREAHHDNAGPPSRFGNTGAMGGNKGGLKHDPAGMARGDFEKAEGGRQYNPLGKLPGSVWTIPTQPLTVPDSLGIDHFAAFPMAFPSRIIRGWSPSGICTVCNEGRRPVVEKGITPTQRTNGSDKWFGSLPDGTTRVRADGERGVTAATITGESCACPQPTAPTRPAVILDPFGGTGTVATVAKVFGRQAIHVDLSIDYCRIAEWRVNDPAQLARAERK